MKHINTHQIQTNRNRSRIEGIATVIGSNKLIMYTLCTFLFIFVVWKSYITSFTHDESFSYNAYVSTRFMDIVSYDPPYTNNHILNTLMMKWSETIFGPSEFTLRLHSLIALALYLFVCCQISNAIPGNRLSSFILLTVNPYLLDFFGLARGYGLSIGCMMLALYFILKWLRTSKLSHIAAFNFCSLLAAWSNFSLVMFYLSAILAVNAVMYLKKRNSGKYPGTHWLRINAINLLFATGTTLILWEPVRKTLALRQLDFGGKSGIVSDTINSVVTSSLYHLQMPPWLTMAISWCALGAILAVSVFCISRIINRKKPYSAVFYKLVLVNCILLCILSGSIAQHYIFGNDYLTGRFALFLYPLFVLHLVWGFQILSGKRKFAGSAAFVSGACGVVATLNLLYNLNLSSYLDWEYDAGTKQMMEVLIKHHHEQGTSGQIRIGNTWYFEPTINFYKNLYQLDWLQPADREQPVITDDYCYLHETHLTRFQSASTNIIFKSDYNSVLIYNQ